LTTALLGLHWQRLLLGQGQLLGACARVHRTLRRHITDIQVLSGGARRLRQLLWPHALRRLLLLRSTRVAALLDTAVRLDSPLLRALLALLLLLRLLLLRWLLAAVVVVVVVVVVVEAVVVVAGVGGVRVLLVFIISANILS